MKLNYSIISESLILCVFLCLAFIVESLEWPKPGVKHGHGKHVVCYIGTWSVYRPGRGSFKIEDIDGNLCTHIVYAFVGLNATTNTLRSIDPYYDLEENYGKGSFKKMTNLKSKYPNLKVTLAVGGWNEGSLNYSTMALESDTRRKFINSVMEYVTKYNFDGFDLDWEFPAARGGRKEDKQNFAILVKELKEELNKKNLILTAALGAAPNTMDAAYDIPEISKHLDLIHFMCYDYHGPWDPTVGPNAPINSNDNLDVESSIKHILKMGAPPEKLVVGIPAYGHTFLTDNFTESGMNSTVTGPGPEGVFTKQKGFQGYNEICAEFLQKENWTLKWDEFSSTPFAVNENHVISYDDPKSIAEKVKLGLRYSVGGFMLWSIDTDDFHGDCNKGHGTSFPLLRTIHAAIEKYSITGNKNDENVVDINSNEIPDSVTPMKKFEKSSANTLNTIFTYCTVLTIFLHFVL